MEASHVPSGSGQLLEQSEANEEDAGARILLPVPHPDFFEAARRTAGRILMNDARVQLEIVDTAANAVQARVLTAGPVSRGKGITLADSSYRTESLGEKDRRITETAGSWPFVRFAVSYVRDAAEMEVYRRQFGEGHDVIAKIERPTAVEDIREIARFCDELWLCRGDLGAEMGLAAMAAAVSRVSRLVKTLEVPCLMAGQVLEHLTLEPHPTRAEVVQLHDLLEDGYCGVVLSDETATGRYPAAACGTAALFRGKRGAGE
jgi:pyruvate kinase